MVWYIIAENKNSIRNLVIENKPMFLIDQLIKL